MTDTLKVFSNLQNQTATSSLSATSLTLASTNSSTQAVLKDVAVEIRHTDSDYATTYNYPTKLKVNGSTVSSNDVGRNSIYNGSLILDTSSTLTLEIQAEEQKIDYGTLRVMIPDSSGANTYYEAPITSDPAGQGAVLAAAVEAGRSSAGSEINANTATGFLKSGVPYVAYADASANVKIIDKNGTEQASVAMGVDITAVASDSTYIYCHGSSAQTHIKRIRISDFVKHSNLTLNGNFPGFGTSNPGWIDHYNGFVYMRHSGGASEVYKANTSNGTLINFNTNHSNESEHLGGRITVASNGTAYIVEWQDTRFFAYNLDTNSFTSNVTATSVFGGWTEPTTTSGNHSATLAPGIVLFRNGSYNQSALVDINSGTPTGTVLKASGNTTILDMGGGGTKILMAGFPQQTAPVNIPRVIQYDTYVSGVEVT
jgi:hypothetical protein